MLAITVEFLTGRFVATSPEDRRRHEWPPHPARFFSALVATWADLEEIGERERAALEWLERQPAPSIVASDTVLRTVRTHFVPVNDISVVGTVPASRFDKIAEAKQAMAKAVGAQRERARRQVENARNVGTMVDRVGDTNPAAALQLLPSGRQRRARYYPSSTPVVPRVHYVWPGSEPSGEIGDALDRILSGVTRLGHSSSLVTCRIDREFDLDTSQMPRWSPDPTGERLVRTTAAGLLPELEASFSSHRGCGPRTMANDVQRYRLLNPGRAVGQLQVPANAGEWFVFAQEASGRTLPIHAAANLTGAVRGALMRYADDPVAELISGHRVDGTHSDNPHLSVIALPFVGREHADGHLLGFAILLPASSPLLSARDEVLRAIGRWEGSDSSGRFRVRARLRGGDDLWFERVQDPLDTWSLRRSRWEGPARTWVSVTPIALDRHPGNLGSDNPPTAARAAREAEESVRTACEHIGVAPPTYIAVTRSSLVTGSRPARSFPPFRGAGHDSPQRLLVHARIMFDGDVRGPLLLGAGRYLGLGLMAPDR